MTIELWFKAEPFTKSDGALTLPPRLASGHPKTMESNLRDRSEV